MKQLTLAIATTVLLALVAAASAQMMTVTLTDGRQFVGEVAKIGENYEIATSMGTVIVPASQVRSVAEYTTPEQEFQKRLAALKADDAQGHYRLAMWALDQKLLAQAKSQLETVLSLQPGNENAKLQLQLVEAQLRAAATAPAVLPPRTDPETVAKSDLMSEADIARVRLEELRSDDRVSIEFQNRALDRFIDRMSGRGDFASRNFEVEFRRWNRVAQTLYMLRFSPRDEELKKDIVVRSDPQFMVTFKSRVWPIIEQNCATSACHGGVKGAGDLKLMAMAAKSDAMYYTNFYILDTYTHNGLRMIWRDHPYLSLLLQYGLPPEVAQYRHPTRITPIFRDTRDPQYLAVRQWIEGLLPIRPQYRLEYQIPGRPEPPQPPAFPPVEPTTVPAVEVGG